MARYDAEEACVQDDGHLVSIHSDDEERFLCGERGVLLHILIWDITRKLSGLSFVNIISRYIFNCV